MTENYTSERVSPAEFLEHHSVKGMKWGVRRRSRELKKMQYRQGILERSALKTKLITLEWR